MKTHQLEVKALLDKQLLLRVYKESVTGGRVENKLDSSYLFRTVFQLWSCNNEKTNGVKNCFHVTNHGNIIITQYSWD